MLEHSSAAGIYERLTSEREPFLRRARDASRLTIPTLMRDEHNRDMDLVDPYQSLGARGVNNLTAKLLLTLLPPNTPFFRYSLSPELENELRGAESLSELQAALSLREEQVQDSIEGMGMRPAIFETLKHLLVAGNALLFASQKTGKLRVFHLSQYAVKRDGEGDILTLVIKEKVAPFKLPEEVRQQVDRSKEQDPSADKDLDLYTVIQRTEDGDFSVQQEVGGVVVPGSEGAFKADRLPYLPLRWEGISDESYGRGFVEQYIGDLRSLEGLSMAIVQGAAIASQCKFLAHPNSGIDVRALTKAPNGSVLRGTPDGIRAIQAEKHADLTVAGRVSDGIEQRLSQAFLLTSSIQRNAERVTAEEVRLMAEDLEKNLGGSYSTLAQELQLPLLRLVEQILVSQGKLQRFPADALVVTITTGLDALGRGHEIQKMQAFLSIVQQTLGPQTIERYMKPSEIMLQLGAGFGMDLSEIVRSDEEIEQADAAAQQAALGQAVAPELVRQGGQALQQQVQAG